LPACEAPPAPASAFPPAPAFPPLPDDFRPVAGSLSVDASPEPQPYPEIPTVPTKQRSIHPVRIRSSNAPPPRVSSKPPASESGRRVRDHPGGTSVTPLPCSCEPPPPVPVPRLPGPRRTPVPCGVLGRAGRRYVSGGGGEPAPRTSASLCFLAATPVLTARACTRPGTAGGPSQGALRRHRPRLDLHRLGRARRGGAAGGGGGAALAVVCRPPGCATFLPGLLPNTP
jgi:hypothetical protein